MMMNGNYIETFLNRVMMLGWETSFSVDLLVMSDLRLFANKDTRL